MGCEEKTHKGKLESKTQRGKAFFRQQDATIIQMIRTRWCYYEILRERTLGTADSRHDKWKTVKEPRG
eukprot:1139990-Pelagomonas_calceolata.AAC.3